MKNRNTAGNRFVEMKNGVIGPVEARRIEIKERVPEDYPDLPRAYLEVADMWGPRFGGPPLCDQFVTVLRHLFTEEEAGAIRHLNRVRGGKTAEEIAGAEHRPVEEIRGVMDVLTDEKRITLSYGAGEKKKYFIQPLLPGAWETILVRTSMDSLTEWHNKFVELFLPLYETGFTTIHLGRRKPSIRYLPVGQSIEYNSMALPSDKLGEIFDSYSDFAVGLCQCRMGADIIGINCGRPMENCVTMGQIAIREIEVGRMRRINIKEALEIKAEAEASGLVSWIMGLEVGGSNTSCSCCGCCCMMMRTISQFNAPGYMAPPHFMPDVNSDKCSYCGKCAGACPMGAWTVNTKEKTRVFDSIRCVGCGLCYVACDKEKAIELVPVPKYDPPTVMKVDKSSHPLAGISGMEKK